MRKEKQQRWLVEQIKKLLESNRRLTSHALDK